MLFIYTNVPNHQIEERIKSSTSPYTRAVSNLPRVKFNYHAAPSKTSQNRTVGLLPNHAVGLLTTLTHEFAPHPYQVLINPRDVFFPYSWKPKDIETVYKINSSESVVHIINNQPIENATDFIEHFILWPPYIPRETWQVDWRLAYILHGLNHALERER